MSEYRKILLNVVRDSSVVGVFHQQTGVRKNQHKALIVRSSTTNYMYQHDIQFFTATILWWKHPQLGIGYA